MLYSRREIRALHRRSRPAMAAYSFRPMWFIADMLQTIFNPLVVCLLLAGANIYVFILWLECRI